MSLLSRFFGKRPVDEPVLIEEAAPESKLDDAKKRGISYEQAISRSTAHRATTTPDPGPVTVQSQTSIDVKRPVLLRADDVDRRKPAGPDRPRLATTSSQKSAKPQFGKDEVARLRRIAEDGNRQWLGLGQEFSCRGRRIRGGMVYVGESLPSLRYTSNPDPALINPKLAVDDRHQDVSGSSLQYWPTYNTLTPGARSAYLNWLETGRGAGAYIGFVFLFFYGIERRVLIDAQALPEAKKEVPTLLDEVERLLSLYGNDSSFRNYAVNFLTAARVLHFGADARDITPPMNLSYEMPLSAKVGLGALVANGEPIPPVWALSWLKSHPETRLRTPAVRCSEEFTELFRLRYQSTFGDGMLLARNRARLSVAYRPASATFAGEIKVSNIDLPDVSKLTGPIRKLWELAENVTKDLEEYSRWVGKNDDRTTLSAISLLPLELMPLVTAQSSVSFRISWNRHWPTRV